jgi:hypothetical protein
MAAVADPFPAPPPDRTSRSRLPAVLIVVAMLAAAAVGALLLLRRADALSFEPVPGWSRIARDVGTGLDERSAASALEVPDVDGFERARQEVWSTPDGPNVRSAILIVVDLKSAGDARRAYDAAVAAHARKRDRFDAPAGYAGFRLDRTELIGEGHRVLFVRDDRVYVVSVTSPRDDDSPAEALRIAQAQTGD